MAMDLNIFPTFDGDQVKFITAQPGQQGASKVTIQLGSITDQQVRATSKTMQKDDVSISEIEVDKDTKKTLRKMGVTSIEDLQEIEKKNVNIDKTSGKKINYNDLLNKLKTIKRNSNPPKVKSVSLSVDADKFPYLYIKGDNLAINNEFKPVAVINEALATVTEHNGNEIKIKLGKENNISTNNNLVLTLDPYAIVKLNVKA
jgi:hypothetical protein